MHLIAVALGGALGAVARHLVQERFAPPASLSFVNGTMVVNVLGSFLMGFLAVALFDRVAPEWRSFLAVGLLGSFTTFSAYSAEFVSHFQHGAYANALLYGTGSVLLGLTGFLLGAAIARGIS